jgi:hypothetical protein
MGRRKGSPVTIDELKRRLTMAASNAESSVRSQGHWDRDDCGYSCALDDVLKFIDGGEPDSPFWRVHEPAPSETDEDDARPCPTT